MKTSVYRKKRSRARQVVRGVVQELMHNGEILVVLAGKRRTRVLCDFMESAATNTLVLRRGDAVLVLRSGSPEKKGCVMGKVGAYRPPDTQRLEFAAGEEVSIRCGEGSITLRKNGQVLIKGLDIVSRAKRNNRIRGGSIQLN